MRIQDQVLVQASTCRKLRQASRPQVPFGDRIGGLGLSSKKDIGAADVTRCRRCRTCRGIVAALPEHVTPHLLALGPRWASLTPYGVTAAL